MINLIKISFNNNTNLMILNNKLLIRKVMSYKIQAFLRKYMMIKDN